MSGGKRGARDPTHSRSLSAFSSSFSPSNLSICLFPFLSSLPHSFSPSLCPAVCWVLRMKAAQGRTAKAPAPPGAYILVGRQVMSQQNKFGYNSRCARRPRNRTGCSQHPAPQQLPGAAGRFKVAARPRGASLQCPLAAALGGAWSPGKGTGCRRLPHWPRTGFHHPFTPGLGLHLQQVPWACRAGPPVAMPPEHLA